MEPINSPQITGQSDTLNPYSPGKYQADFSELLDSLVEEYDKRF